MADEGKITTNYRLKKGGINKTISRSVNFDWTDPGMSDGIAICPVGNNWELVDNTFEKPGAMLVLNNGANLVAAQDIMIGVEQFNEIVVCQRCVYNTAYIINLPKLPFYVRSATPFAELYYIVVEDTSNGAVSNE